MIEELNEIKSNVKLKSTKKNGKYINWIIQDYEDNKIIPLPDVNGKILQKIVDYLNHYESSEPKKIEKPLRKYKMEQNFDKWDYNFFDMKLKILLIY